MKLALRTQQVIADETNVTATVDPLGGSYLVEKPHQPDGAGNLRCAGEGGAAGRNG